MYIKSYNYKKYIVAPWELQYLKSSKLDNATFYKNREIWTDISHNTVMF